MFFLFMSFVNVFFSTLYHRFIARTDAHLELNQFRRKQDCALVVSGESLEVCLQYYQDEFMELATASPAVVCCRKFFFFFHCAMMWMFE